MMWLSSILIGEDPVEVARLRQLGSAVDEADREGDDEHVNDDNQISIPDVVASALDESESNGNIIDTPLGSEYQCIRQTLLFSATAIQQKERQEKLNKRVKLNGTLKGISQNSCLPNHLKQ